MGNKISRIHKGYHPSGPFERPVEYHWLILLVTSSQYRMFERALMAGAVMYVVLKVFGVTGHP